VLTLPSSNKNFFFVHQEFGVQVGISVQFGTSCRTTEMWPLCSTHSSPFFFFLTEIILLITTTFNELFIRWSRKHAREHLFSLWRTKRHMWKDSSGFFFLTNLVYFCGSRFFFSFILNFGHMFFILNEAPFIIGWGWKDKLGPKTAEQNKFSRFVSRKLEN